MFLFFGSVLSEKQLYSILKECKEGGEACGVSVFPVTGCSERAESVSPLAGG